MAGLLVALAVALCMRHHARQRDKERLAALGPEGAQGDTTFEYQVCKPRSLTGKWGLWSEGSWELKAPLMQLLESEKEIVRAC